MKRVCVVVPTYNEVDNICQLLDSVFAKAKSKDYTLKVLIVDDKSPDGTAKVAKKHAADNGYNVAIASGNKAGLGKAYMNGFQVVKKHDLADIIVMMDADLSHDAAEVPRLIEKLSYADLAIGSRYVEGGMIPGDWPFLRIINSKVARFVTRFIGGLDNSISDPTAGFRAFELETLSKYEILPKGKASGYVFMVNMSNAFQKNNLVIAEHPIQFRDRTEGESKIRMSDVMEYFVFCYGMNSVSPFKKGLGRVLEVLVVFLAYLVAQNFANNQGIPSIVGLIAASQVAIVTGLALNWRSIDWISQLKYSAGRMWRIKRMAKQFVYFNATITTTMVASSYALSSGYVLSSIKLPILLAAGLGSALIYRRYVIPLLNPNNQL